MCQAQAPSAADTVTIPPAAAGSLLPGAGPMPGGLCHPGGSGREGMDSPAARTGSPSSGSFSGNQDPSKQHIYGGGKAAARLPGASSAAAVPREDSGTEPHRPLCPHHARARDVPLGAGDMGQPGEQSWGQCQRDSDRGGGVEVTRRVAALQDGLV